MALAHLFEISYTPFRYLEYTMQSLFFTWRGSQPPHPDVVILAIDEDSLRLSDLFEPEEFDQMPDLATLQTWPWPRAIYGQALHHLIQAGAKSVVFDLVFRNPSVHGREDDLAFQAAIQSYPDRIILAESYPLATQTIDQVFQSSASLVDRPIPELLVPGVRTGSVELPIAPNRQVFEIPGRDLVADFNNPLPVVAAGIEVPPTTLGINYSGPQQTYPTYPFWWLFEPSFWQNNLRSGQVFQGKIVLIGGTAASLLDLLSTPVDPVMPGVEVHANAIGTLLNQNGIQFIPAGWRALLMLVVGSGIGGLLVLHQHPAFKLSLTLLASAGMGALGYGMFLTGWVFPVPGLLGTILITGILDIVAIGINDQFNRSKLRRILERRVSPAVLGNILSQPESFAQALGGQECQVTILFSDIRGFTTLAAMMPAQDLVALLNRYFANMVTPILQQKGTLDKFIGDAVMAEFGAPLSRGSAVDALAAVDAALEMRHALYELRKSLKTEGLPLIYHGIGINFGEVVAGNLGSPDRIEYTVIGDAVNVAARIEGLTKVVHYDIVISDTVQALVKDEIWTEDLGFFDIRGRSDPVHLYGVVDRRGGDGWLCRQIQLEHQALAQQQTSNAPGVD